MSKLWIVHRQPRLRDALARLSRVAPGHRVEGAPTDDVFATAPAPAAILIGFEDDFERELDFLHRYDDRLRGARRRFLVVPEDAAEVMRLAGATRDEIVEGPPEPHALRDFVVSAVAHRNAEPLAARREREQLAARFAHWFGELEIPGLLRALDPALARLPLLVRGVPGSGRGLAASYVDRFRRHETNGDRVRLDAHDADPIAALEARLANATPSRTTTIQIDDVDRLPWPTQRILADWIRIGPPPGLASGTLRWLATARPASAVSRETLEPGLAAALAPLTLTIPSLAEDPGATAAFAERQVAEWSARFGGPERRLDDSAHTALETIAWVGDRIAVEGALREALVRTSDATLTSEHLDGDAAAALAWRGASDSLPPERPGSRPGPDAPTPPPGALFDDAPVIPATDPEPRFDSDPSAIEPAVFVDTLVPSEATADLEQAFAAGLEDTGPEIPGSFGGANDEDPSRAMSDEAFGATTARAGAHIAAPGEAPRATEPAPDWRRLARSLSHEIRNPLVSIRTFTQLLPEHFEDDAFRTRFTELVGRDVDHIDAVIDRLARAAEPEKYESAAVDVSELIEGLLDARRTQIGERRLLVLRELERDAPIAWADPNALEIAIAGLLDRALAALPERGDLFVATRRIDRGPDGAPRLRILLRHHNPELAGTTRDTVTDATMAANVIEYVLAETIVEASGGKLTIDATDAEETLILIDLRTPGEHPS